MHLFEILMPFFFMFLVGSCIGSFLNVLIDRLPNDKNVFLGRSHCDNCKKNLSPLELFPIFSFLVLKGKCKNCETVLKKRMFFVEIATGALFICYYSFFLFYALPLSFFLYILLVTCLFIPIIFTDLEYGIIPDQLVIFLAVVISFYTILISGQNIANHFLTGTITFIVFLLLFVVTKGKGMGFGDVKLSFVLGLFLGFPNILVGFYGAFLTGAGVSIILVLWGRKNFKKDTIPFGPFLVFSTLFSFFFGEKIITAVLRYFS